MLEPMPFVDEGATSYETVTDLFKTFTEEMYSLYLLSLLLTADHDKAERCFVSAIAQCEEGSGAFMEWARSWARHAVLHYAIQMIMPVPEYADSLSFISLQGPATSAENNLFAAVGSLGAFERFVYVMSVLEGQSDKECAMFLRCSRQDVIIARLLALKRLAKGDPGHAQADEFMQA
jgi:hypothetical protein